MFQIHALDPAPFAALFEMPNEDLASRRALRMTVSECPGSPCRVTLEDAQVGETVILANFEHLSTETPFRGTHAVFVRENATRAHPARDEVPAALQARTLSLRALSEDGLMVAAQLAKGSQIAASLDQLFENDKVQQVQLHFAGPGCFAATATRPGVPSPLEGAAPYA